MTAGLVPAVQAARPQPPDADFDALRAAAMATVQSEEAPAPAGWTDHNLHDPGITLLEAALFAVADLHYRTAERRFDAWPFELRGWRGLVPPATTADREDAAAFFAVAANVTAARAIVARASSRTRALLDLASATFALPPPGGPLRLRPAVAAAVLRALREPVLQRALLDRSGGVDWAVATTGPVAARATAERMVEDLGLWPEEVDALVVAAARRRLVRFVRRSGDELRAIVDGAATATDAVTALEGPFDEGEGALLSLSSGDATLALGVHPCPPAAPELWEPGDFGETAHWPPHPLQARTCEPVTRDDYRRLALAVAGVRRAWVVPGLTKGIKWTGGVTNAAPRPNRLGAVTILVDPSARALLRFDADVTGERSFLLGVLNGVLGGGSGSGVEDAFPDYRDAVDARGPRRLLGDEVVAAPLLTYPVVVRGTLEIVPTANGDLVLAQAEVLLSGFISPLRSSPLEPPPPAPAPLRCPQDLDGPWPPEAAARAFVADPQGLAASGGWQPGDPVRVTELVQLLHEVPGVVGVDKLQVQVDGEGPTSWHDELPPPAGYERFTVPTFLRHCLCIRIFDPKDCRNA